MSSKNHSQPDLIIKCGQLLPMEGPVEILHNMNLEISGGVIKSIVPSGPVGDEVLPSPPVPIIDASHDLVMPGLVNCHSHVPMTLFRGMADDLPLHVWLFNKIFPAEAKYLSPESVYWGTLLGCAEMIASGTTFFADGYFFEDQVFKAVHEAGMRALLAQGIIDFPAPGVPDPDKKFILGRQFVEQFRGVSELIVPSLFCHSPVTCSEETLIRSMELCREFEIPLQIHLSETVEEVIQVKEKTGKSPVHLLESLGVLGPDLIAAHCIHLEPEEIDVLGSAGVKAVHVPESNMKLASGMARVPEMIEAGIKVGLGTDGCASNNNLDIIAEMDTAAKLAKISSGNPLALPARTVLAMGTIWGAGVLGMDTMIGSLGIGKKADIIVLDLDQPHLNPLYDPFSTIVYSAKGGDVKHVIINGEVVYENREFTRLDIERIMWEVRKICETIGEDMGKD